jgi:hypothetical protein
MVAKQTTVKNVANAKSFYNQTERGITKIYKIIVLCRTEKILKHVVLVV